MKSSTWPKFNVLIDATPRGIMPHEAETDFQDRVEAWLRTDFGNVEKEPRLPQTGRYPDFIIHTAFKSWVIEVENDIDAAIEGLGQTLFYAAHGDYTPVLIVPAEHTQGEYKPEWDRICAALRSVDGIPLAYKEA